MPCVALALMMLAVALFISGLPVRRVAMVTAQTVTPDGTLTELAIDDGSAECAFGPPGELKGKPVFGWVNKLTPPSYPATLRAITIGFERRLAASAVKPDSLYRIVVYLDPEGDGPNNNQKPDAAFIGRVRGADEIMTFNLITPLTIQSGSLVVGALDVFGIADIPALFDRPGKSNPPGSESFFTLDGGAMWFKLSEVLVPTPQCPPGSWLIRATVELGSIDPSNITTIKDPAAVEPWGVGSLGTEVIVTNLVSDNVTIINSANNTFKNLQLVDLRLCPACGPPLGPFGVASVPTRNKAYVTLVGTNTIPSKEFPVDYSTVLPGRVVILTRAQDGFVQSGFISVGAGPKFPAVASGKLYVPCGGAARVDVIDTATDQKVAEIPVGKDPSSCTATLDESKIYVTNFGDGTISVVDTKTDKKIKDIPAPVIQFPLRLGASLPVAERPAEARNPWMAAVSHTNGNLYVTYWSSTVGVTGGAVVDVTPNGAVVEFDTCKDEFLRAILDDTTRGTAPGSPGASGIPAPTAPLTRDPVTGRTLQAGGGGGGPFGIAACLPNALDVQPLTFVFTNDGVGITGVIDARFDQLVSAPPISLASCPKPRGLACINVDVSSLSGGAAPPRPTHFAYVACGQPDNAVLVFRVPELPENIANIPVIESVEIGDVLRLFGRGFAAFDMRVEVARGASCLRFNKEPLIKKNARVLVQKGALSDGSRLSDAVNRDAIIRLIHPDGTVRVIKRPAV